MSKVTTQLPIRSSFGHALAQALKVSADEKIRIHLFKSVFIRIQWRGSCAIIALTSGKTRCYSSLVSQPLILWAFCETVEQLLSK
ncbi:MAG TPA: hypothetical protein EYP10_05795 [Armatimonadetes bacterium]|nr:hypothetical protein [Armatimonadota bacterium]